LVKKPNNLEIKIMFKFRRAKLEDIPFLIETIIAAEKSGSDVLTYTTLFGLSEKETRNFLVKILAEEIDGCELSVSSFLIALVEEKIVAAIAAWIEGSEGVPSTILKGNLLNYFLPREAIIKASSHNSIVREIHIDYTPNAIQVGLIYVNPAFRGQNLVSLLIEKQTGILMQKSTLLNAIYIQVYGNNFAAIKAYEKIGFINILEKKSTHKDILLYMPSDTKILMKRELT
jgi:ribosomal protein S18 acetylase RimI-like enzyme